MPPQRGGHDAGPGGDRVGAPRPTRKRSFRPSGSIPRRRLANASTSPLRMNAAEMRRDGQTRSTSADTPPRYAYDHTPARCSGRSHIAASTCRAFPSAAAGRSPRSVISAKLGFGFPISQLNVPRVSSVTVARAAAFGSSERLSVASPAASPSPLPVPAPDSASGISWRAARGRGRAPPGPAPGVPREANAPRWRPRGSPGTPRPAWCAACAAESRARSAPRRTTRARTRSFGQGQVRDEHARRRRARRSVPASASAKAQASRVAGDFGSPSSAMAFTPTSSTPPTRSR